ncbi:MAG: hypothetical protein IKG92_01570, partial [Bacteroidales bacterium]|nr:hypothetical protein [Bacteroidales bacterium]
MSGTGLILGPKPAPPKMPSRGLGGNNAGAGCLSLKKVDSQINLEMGRTSDNHAKYYNEVVRLYFEEGLGSQKLAHII